MRSTCNWYDELCEKSTKFFLNLEKHCAIQKSNVLLLLTPRWTLQIDGSGWNKQVDIFI